MFFFASQMIRPFVDKKTRAQSFTVSSILAKKMISTDVSNLSTVKLFGHLLLKDDDSDVFEITCQNCD